MTMSATTLGMHAPESFSETDTPEPPRSEQRVILDNVTARDGAPRLSQILWGIDWTQMFPRTLVDGITVSVVDFDVARRFIEAHYAEIFETDPNAGWFTEPMNDAKRRYFEHVADCFAFYDGERVVGISIWNPSDWSTCYLRSAGVLPECNGKRLIWRLIPIILTELERVGVNRLELESAPANGATQLNALRTGFSVTGTTLTDRWGALVRLTRYINPDAERTFGDKFCGTARPTLAQSIAEQRSRDAAFVRVTTTA